MYCAFPVASHAGCVANGANWISTPDYASVSQCVSNADAGDTITVSAGSATWSTQLSISKRITLQGNGIGKTVISAGTSGMSMIYVNLSSDSSTILRISGFSFNMAGLASCGLSLKNGTTNKVHNVRIDSNRFYNNNGRMIEGRGPIWGVIDNNIFDNIGHFKVADFYGNNNRADWDKFQNDRDYGTVDNMYFEDNTVTSTTTVTSTGQGGRYCLRFNTYDSSKFTLSGMLPLWDQHGNQWENYGNLMVEIYKNTIIAGTKGGYLADQRGGHGMIWGNNVSSTVSLSAVKVRDEFDDVAYPSKNNPGTYIARVSNSYYWLNRKNTSTLLGAFIAQQSDDSCSQYCDPSYGCKSGYCIENNVNFWVETASFKGTSGVGVGLLSARPATCTTGVGYWATDQGNWNKSGSGGQGVLYKCTSTNTWTEYYTPYTYPHPLRTGGNEPITGLTAPSNLIVK